MKLSININDRFKFKLTKYGQQLNKNCKYPLLMSEDGIVYASIWEIAETFGDYLYNGAEQIIENNELEFKGGV